MAPLRAVSHRFVLACMFKLFSEYFVDATEKRRNKLTEKQIVTRNEIKINVKHKKVDIQHQPIKK